QMRCISDLSVCFTGVRNAEVLLYVHRCQCSCWCVRLSSCLIQFSFLPFFLSLLPASPLSPVPSPGLVSPSLCTTLIALLFTPALRCLLCRRCPQISHLLAPGSPPSFAQPRMDPLPLLIYLCTVLAPSHGFSVDVEVPIRFQEAAAGFGQSVVQFGSVNTGGLLVGAPLHTGDVNETGKVYKCDPGSRSCKEIPIQRPPDAVNMSLGLSLAARDSNLLVCGPTVHRACGQNMYVNGYCFLLDQSLRQLQRIPDTLAECPRPATDIALLIDGSGSIAPEDFTKMKTFLSEIMKRFHNTDTQFALMQYSHRFREHFDFLRYRSSRDPDGLLRSVWQLRGATYTATAIQKVVQDLFISWKGARDQATKILIVITDGEKSGDPLSYSDVIPEAERAGIIRYAIGVS
ncbi:integrin, alpha D, partial [Chelydra serpentina]